MCASFVPDIRWAAHLFSRGGLSGGASAAGMAGVREREYSETQRKPIRDSLFLHFGLTRSKELITFAFRVTAKPAGSRQVAGPSQTANLTYDMQSFTPEVQKRFKYWQMRTLIAPTWVFRKPAWVFSLRSTGWSTAFRVSSTVFWPTGSTHASSWPRDSRSARWPISPSVSAST